MALQKIAVTGLLAELGYHHHTRPELHVWYSWADRLVSEAAAYASLVTILRGSCSAGEVLLLLRGTNTSLKAVLL